MLFLRPVFAALPLCVLGALPVPCFCPICLREHQHRPGSVPASRTAVTQVSWAWERPCGTILRCCLKPDVQQSPFGIQMSCPRP